MSGEIDNRNCNNFYDKPIDKVSMEHSRYEKTEDGDIFIGVDEDGNEVCRNVDAGYDGYYEYRSNLNEDGTTSEELVDRDHDGYVDIYVSYDYEEGAKDGEESVRHIDYDLDGVTDVTSYLDGKGNITADDIDTDGDGKADIHVDYINDENGKEIQRIVDENGDGIPDYVSTVDEEGRVTADDIDTDGDGVLDTHVEYTYNTKGEVMFTNERSLTLGSSEATIPDDCTVEGTRIYNADGKQIGIVLNTEKDGKTVQQIYSLGSEVLNEDTVTYKDGKYTTKSSDGLMVAQEADEDGDGTVDMHYEYFYESGTGQYIVKRKTTLVPSAETTIPPDSFVKGNRIFNADGNQIGVIITTTQDGQEVQKIYLLDKER